MSLTYAKYLKLDDLLSLQAARSDPPEHDEMLFIVIHQTYELWFKLMLHEIEKINRDFDAGDLFSAIHTFKRLRTVMKTLVAQLDILETMTPMSFTSFRDRLEDASGFQSVQFRALEFALGFKRPETLKYHSEPAARQLLEDRLNEPSLSDHFSVFVRLQYASDQAAQPADHSSPTTEPDGPLPDVLFALYRRRPELTILFELMTDFDEGLQEWRYRHIKLVERTIGSKRGTGGSPGVEFLKESLFKPIFPELWAIRHRL